MKHDSVKALNTICPHCQKGHLEISPENYPYNIEHLMCNNCYSTHSIDYTPMYMEDVRSITIDMIELMERRLSGFGIKMPDKNIDIIHDVLWGQLELVCPNDYKYHN